MIKSFIYIVIGVLIIVGISRWVSIPQTAPNPSPANTVEQKTTTNNYQSNTSKSTYVKPNPVQVQNQLQTQISNQAPAPAKVFLADHNITINASDSGADITTINVPKGVRVNLTINVSASGAGHGGLDFRSPIINTNTIAPGGTINTGFIADKSFVITPYWPATNTATPYRINITVQQ